MWKAMRGTPRRCLCSVNWINYAFFHSLKLAERNALISHWVRQSWAIIWSFFFRNFRSQHHNQNHENPQNSTQNDLMSLGVKFCGGGTFVQPWTLSPMIMMTNHIDTNVESYSIMRFVGWQFPIELFKIEALVTYDITSMYLGKNI